MRFDVAVLLTVVVLAYVAVPRVAGLLDAVGSYDHGQFEPKDAERGAWLQRVHEPGVVQTTIPWETMLHIAPFPLVMVWLTLWPARALRRPGAPPPR